MSTWDTSYLLYEIDFVGVRSSKFRQKPREILNRDLNKSKPRGLRHFFCHPVIDSNCNRNEIVRGLQIGKTNKCYKLHYPAGTVLKQTTRLNPSFLHDNQTSLRNRIWLNSFELMKLFWVFGEDRRKLKAEKCRDAFVCSRGIDDGSPYWNPEQEIRI